MIDSGNEELRCAESEGSMADQLDLVVHALDGAAGNAVLGPRQDSIQVGNAAFARIS